MKTETEDIPTDAEDWEEDEEEEDDNCVVCGDEDCNKKNSIVYCDGENCDIPVHQRCYEIENIPEGEWYCERCTDDVSTKDMELLCCERKDEHSAYKRAVSDTGTKGYVHVVCVVWNGLTNKDPDNKYIIPTGNPKKCYVCLEEVGICCTCQAPDCTKTFHASCAIAEEFLEPQAPHKIDPTEVFCESHVDLKKQLDKQRMKRSGRISEREKSRSHSYEQRVKRKRLMSSESDSEPVEIKPKVHKEILPTINNHSIDPTNRVVKKEQLNIQKSKNVDAKMNGKNDEIQAQLSKILTEQEKLFKEIRHLLNHQQVKKGGETNGTHQHQQKQDKNLLDNLLNTSFDQFEKTQLSKLDDETRQLKEKVSRLEAEHSGFHMQIRKLNEEKDMLLLLSFHLFSSLGATCFIVFYFLAFSSSFSV